MANRLLNLFSRKKSSAALVCLLLADLTGDSLDELLVLTMGLDEVKRLSLREEITEDRFAYGRIKCFGARDGRAFQYPSTLEAGCIHPIWGFVYLVPRGDSQGFALLDFRPYFGQGAGSYSYRLYAADKTEGFVALEKAEAIFQADQSSAVADTMEDATVEEVQALLDRMRVLQDSGPPC